MGQHADKRQIKVAYVLSYRSPNYVRSEALIDMLQASKFQIYKAINTKRGVWRYFQSIGRLLRIRLTNNPDVYILGFRGQDIFWLVRLITLGKPLIFDEFVNLYLWTVEEHDKVRRGTFAARIVSWYSRKMLRAADHILCDTAANAQYSAKQANIDSNHFTSLYVGTNETLFAESSYSQKSKMFEVFYYGSKFLPLHGVDIVVDAAAQLQDLPVHLTIIGGGEGAAVTEKFKAKVKELNLDNVSHLPRVPYEELREYAAKADVCLGGPFGDTPQSKVVITGKTFQFISMAKPVIVGENSETKNAGFIDKKNSLLVKRGDAKSLAEAIKWAYAHQSALPAIGKSGKELYDQRFSVAAQKGKLADLIETLVVPR